MSETVYCGIDGCNAEAYWQTSDGTPLCEGCADAYQLGQGNPDTPVVRLEEQ